MKQGFEKWLIIPDLQWPYIDTKSVAAVLQYARENHWDGMLQLGDFMDWDFISKWTAENARRTEGHRFLKEYENANKFLDILVKATRAKNPKAKIVILEGNHDYRVEVVIDKTPLYEGMIEMEKNLRFKQRKILYHRYWTTRQPYRIGKALFVHGEYTNDHHAKKMASAFNEPVYYGHTHDHQSYSKITLGGDRDITAESLGTLSRYDLPYMGKKPSNWRQGFAVFYFLPNGFFNHFFIDIFKHRFISPDGKIYDGNILCKAPR